MCLTSRKKTKRLMNGFSFTLMECSIGQQFYMNLVVTADLTEVSCRMQLLVMENESLEAIQ